MNLGRILLAALVGTITYYVVGFFVFGLAFRSAYEPYRSVYRHQEATMRLMPIGMIGTFIAITMMATIFARFMRTGGIGDGAFLGVLFGIFAASALVGENFVTLPIGGKLAAFQAIGAIVAWTIVGSVVGLIYKQ